MLVDYLNALPNVTTADGARDIEKLLVNDWSQAIITVFFSHMIDLVFCLFVLGSLFVSLLIIGGWLFWGSLIIRAILSSWAPSKVNLTDYYVRNFWLASIFGIIGYLMAELGYQLFFWQAPGIWGAQGRTSTAWGKLQYVLPIVAFPIGLWLNTVLEHRFQERSRTIWIAVIGIGALLLIATLSLGAWHGLETIG